MNTEDTAIVALLRACAKKKDLCRGTKLHADVLKRGVLEKSSHVANALVSMYAKCGSLTKARELLLGLPFRDVFSWNALIAGYSQHGHGEEALHCFDQMQHDGISPDEVTFTCILKACGNIKAAQKGEQIHDEIARQGLPGNNVLLGTALVDMYAKCGALAKAQQALDELPVRDVVSWSALIAGYAQQGQGEEALNCFQRMQSEGLSPDKVTFLSILKACGSIGATHKGKEIHDEIVRQGLLGKDYVLGTALVDMYAKCGALVKAQEVLHELPVQDVICWNALIAGYAQQGQGEDALKCFEQMQCKGLSPNAVTFTCVLKACGSIRAADKGEQIHDEITKQGLLRNNTVLGNALVDMYAKCGTLAKAQRVLEELHVQDVISWNTLISGYTQQEQGEDALDCFEQMQHRGLSPDDVTFTCVLKACGSIGAADKGEQIHEEIARHGLLGRNIVLGNALVDMYAKCGALVKAQRVLEELPNRDVISWNVLVAGYTQQGRGEDALKCFKQMQHEGLSPSSVTYTCILKACASIGAADQGEQIHDEIARQGLLENNVVLGNALVDMYVKCGVLEKAWQLLEQLSIWDAASWNALIGGYIQQGKGNEAWNCFEQMQRTGVSPNEITFSCILRACGITRALAKGEHIHDVIAKLGFLGKSIALNTALVDMYAKCGALPKAQGVFDEFPTRDVVLWSALIAGYAQQGQVEEALNCFEQMQHEGLSPDEVTFTCILKACGSIGAVDKGEQVHDEIARQGLLRDNIVLGNTLVDMYAKCGALAKAQNVLEELPVQDVISWNALITGYAQHGQAQDVVKCFERMQHECISPDATTFSCVLNACSHSGLVDEGQMYFSLMTTKYGVMPDLEHYTCMVDLLGRAGHFDKAIAVIQRMPSSDYPAVWSTLLGACQKWGDVKVGRWAFEHAIQVDKNDTTVYVCMANIYAAAGMEEDAKRIEILRVKNKAWEKPWCG